MTPTQSLSERLDDRDFVHEHRALIAVAEACWRVRDPSYSWHVFDWMAWKLRWKYPPIRREDGIVNWSGVVP